MVLLTRPDSITGWARRISSEGLRTVTILAAFFSIEPSLVSARAKGGPGLAHELYIHKDYYRAITEYKREAFFADSAHQKRWADFRIGESYRKSGRAEESVSYLARAARFSESDELSDSCVFSLARSYIQMGSFPAARAILDSLGKEVPCKLALAGWSSLLEGDFETARGLFASAGRDSLADLAAACTEIRWKSPAAAAVMSAILPGSGQVYAGGYRQGVTSFLLHALFGYLTYRAIDDHRYFEAAAAVYTGFSRFYVGNIISASSLVREDNHRRMDEVIRTGLTEHGEDLE